VAFLTIDNVTINGITTCVPKTKVSNKNESYFTRNEALEFIKTTGIEYRHVVKNNMQASDLCIAASKKLISELKWATNEIELLVFVTQTPDNPIPGSATRIKDELQLSSKCMALDIHQGCSGYVYGLSVITSLLSHGSIKKALLLVGDTITKILDKNDKSVQPLFSDAGSATALSFKNGAPSMFFNLQSDGSGKDFIYQPKNGFMKMEGLKIFSFGLKEVAPNMNALLLYANIDINKIDFFIVHQANKLINESIRKKMNVPSNKFPYSLQLYGNTSNTTIPTTINLNLTKLEHHKSHRLCLSGFGVGLLWGSAIIELSNAIIPEIIEI
jgi:3-oxoacyl-[acyl-carrier-protein] synthase-3